MNYKPFFLLLMLGGMLFSAPKKTKPVDPLQMLYQVFSICDAQFFSSLELKKNKKFSWEFHDQEGRIFATKGQWIYSPEEKILTLNPFEDSSKISLSALEPLTDSAAERKVFFYLNNKLLTQDARLGIRLNQGEVQRLFDEKYLVFVGDLQTIHLQMHPGLSAEIMVENPAQAYRVDIFLAGNEEILVRNSHLVYFDGTLLVSKIEQDEYLFFERFLRGKRFFVSSTKEINNCPTNAKRIIDPSETKSGINVQ